MGHVLQRPPLNPSLADRYAWQINTSYVRHWSCMPSRAMMAYNPFEETNVSSGTYLQTVFLNCDTFATIILSSLVSNRWYISLFINFVVSSVSILHNLMFSFRGDNVMKMSKILQNNNYYTRRLMKLKKRHRWLLWYFLYWWRPMQELV